MKHTTKIVRIVCVVLAAMMAMTLLLPLVNMTFAETAAEKVNRLQQELNAINQKIESNKNNIAKQEETKQYYQAQSNILASQIEGMKAQIAETELQLAQKQVELEQKILDVERTKTLFEQRLVAMYKTHNRSQLSTLLGASTFAEAMRFAKNLQEISISDTDMIQQLRDEQAQLEAQKAEVETMLAGLNEQKSQLEVKRTEYAASIQAANNAITQEEANLSANEAAYGDKYQEQQRAKEELQAWINSNNTVDFEWGGGVFGPPIQSYTRISSNYGWRTLYGQQDFHRGVDFAAPAGTPIYAADSGVVSTTAHWSYGTCVKISHGSGLVTVYGHMSARAAGISDGVYVAKGQCIGYVGSTGNSSGNHLHFEVNLNGAVQDPWSYLKG